MNVLIISQNIAIGGAQRVVIHLSDFLSRSGHNAWILTPHLDFDYMPELARRQRYIPCPYPILQKVGHEYKMRNNIFSLAFNILRMRNYLKGVVKEYEIDLINPHNPPSNWISSFSRVPVVWSCNEPISLCFSRWKPDYFPLSVEPPSPLSHALEFIYEAVDRVLCGWGIDEIVVLSRHTQKGVRNIYNRSAHVCRVGVDFEPFHRGNGQHLRQQYQCENPFVLLQVSHFKPEKNHEVSIRAVHLLKDRIPELRLMFVGAGALLEPMKRLTEDLSITDKVFFAGRVSDEQLPDYYDACDLVVFPAIRQSWGLVVFEALAAGKVSVASSDCGASEVLQDESIGFVADPTPEAFAEKIMEIYLDRRLLNGMAERGREYVRKDLSYEAYGRRMLHLFEEILNRKAKCSRRGVR